MINWTTNLAAFKGGMNFAIPGFFQQRYSVTSVNIVWTAQDDETTSWSAQANVSTTWTVQTDSSTTWTDQ